MRPRLTIGMLLVTGALAAGCAGRVEAPVAASPRTEVRCLPPGVSAEFFAWPVHAFRPLRIPRADGSSANAAWVLYKSGASEVAVVWRGTELVAVDPSPRTRTPIWIDASVLDREESSARTSTAPCRWRRDLPVV
jgi:hypothetical protein